MDQKSILIFEIMKSLTALSLSLLLAAPVQAKGTSHRCFEGAMFGGVAAVTAVIAIAREKGMAAIPVALLSGMLLGCHLAAD